MRSIKGKPQDLASATFGILLQIVLNIYEGELCNLFVLKGTIIKFEGDWSFYSLNDSERYTVLQYDFFLFRESGELFIHLKHLLGAGEFNDE